ncbi:hypothetical protein KOM00_10450 [Geomonas sp. Red69]|uniref:hypothetical protein n=1 Tax=Geomonas diazotrophica TaxID=2843197 RepID=UPI001C0FBC40|nr:MULTISPECIES: hypothetical protein [Geomonas]MBU5637153.1 hypothetical protein [Geomonas diazotrophica]QXE88627.1 hypothetical protein KP003_09590 [Geomonas nitrogeniifigens]
MTTEHLQKVTDQLAKLHGHAYFRVEEGALKECLTGLILDAVEGDLAEQLAGGSFDLEVSVGVQEGENEPAVDFRVDRPGVVYRSDATISRLSVPALEDLGRYLEHLALSQTAPAAEEKGTGSNVVRKKQDHDHHEQEAAAARLKVTPQWLKSVVPCTDYSYDEIDGKKYIREYYWSRELIERLFKIKSSKTTPEDLQYVAQECCDGDADWARDLIARLKSPNRPEQQQKDQSQKNQPQKEKEKGAVQQQAKPAAGDRPRSRSRHRKSFRHGKDGARKPEGTAEAKKPS